ncbi:MULTISPECIES: hypothetical protein [unclassified Photorhabdus]|uniref:hypothetical protein n=1 Tax=unclassified Photorhabdus TaxID=2620880 RepID=UPI000DCDB71B|nr:MULTISPECIES: hypothetical protein [unclassified Photorhabdus]RAW92147.1 hypothetical protein CKY05_23545 [Photorhabdus sp. S10-54]RAW92179.1 hypothetical protein CKY03_23490 [Photorhabdus sp. S9-53]RAW95678.1 hypothetical protein CKY04_23580 [Photorhabdus sp. S8-52]
MATSGYNQQVSTVLWLSCHLSISLGMNDFKVLAEQTGGAVFSALAGGSHSSSNNEKTVVTGSVRVNNGVSLQLIWRNAWVLLLIKQSWF